MKVHSIGSYTYKFQAKTWTLFDENDQLVTSLPAGGKLTCLQEGIRQQRPTIFQAAQSASTRHPEADGFIWRAAALLLNGFVYEPRAENQINEVARVRSESFDANKPFDRLAGYDRDGFYSIQEDGFLTCNCDSYHSDYGPTTKDGWKLCKHIMAVMLAKASDTPLREFEPLRPKGQEISLAELNEMLFS